MSDARLWWWAKTNSIDRFFGVAFFSNIRFCAASSVDAHRMFLLLRFKWAFCALTHKFHQNRFHVWLMAAAEKGESVEQFSTYRKVQYCAVNLTNLLFPLFKWIVTMQRWDRSIRFLSGLLFISVWYSNLWLTIWIEWIDRRPKKVRYLSQSYKVKDVARENWYMTNT